MKFITTPERKKAEGDMVTLCALCSEDPKFCGNDNGNGGGKPDCPSNGSKPCKEEMHTLCALCSEDPAFCGPGDLF